MRLCTSIQITLIHVWFQPFGWHMQQLFCWCFSRDSVSENKWWLAMLTTIRIRVFESNATLAMCIHRQHNSRVALRFKRANSVSCSRCNSLGWPGDAHMGASSMQNLAPCNLLYTSLGIIFNTPNNITSRHRMEHFLLRCLVSRACAITFARLKNCVWHAGQIPLSIYLGISETTLCSIRLCCSFLFHWVFWGLPIEWSGKPL